jgi:hypothetical protein
MAVNELFFEKNPGTDLSHQIQVRPFNADKTRNMRALNPEGKLKLSFSVMAIVIVLIYLFQTWIN